MLSVWMVLGAIGVFGVSGLPGLPALVSVARWAADDGVADGRRQPAGIGWPRRGDARRRRRPSWHVPWFLPWGEFAVTLDALSVMFPGTGLRRAGARLDLRPGVLEADRSIRTTAGDSVFFTACSPVPWPWSSSRVTASSS